MTSCRIPAAYALISFVIAVQAAQAVEVEWLFVGDHRNVADTNGFGKVIYDYNISKFEITNLQYAEFLNAVASTDTYDLYSADMTSGPHNTGGIIRNGPEGNYSYRVHTGRENHPVVYVNWYDAIRFANWMHNGQPQGMQDENTTEDGAYTIQSQFEVGPRNADARVFLPSRDEWYKAAYYKGGSTDTGYWQYATSSDELPSSELPPGVGNSANYAFTPGTGGLTNVGEYASSVSPYGAFDMNGNAFEWTEEFTSSLTRGIRGGSWLTGANTLSSQTINSNGHLDEQSNVGFRLAYIPEPTTMLLALLGAVSYLARYRVH